MDFNNTHPKKFYSNLKKLFQRNKPDTQLPIIHKDLNNQKNPHATRSSTNLSKLPPLTLPKNVITYKNFINNKTTPLPTMPSKPKYNNNDRLRTNLLRSEQYISSPDEFSTLYNKQTIEDKPSIETMTSIRPTNNKSGTLRMSKDSWFEDTTKDLEKGCNHKGRGMMNLDIVTTLRKKTSMTTSGGTSHEPLSTTATRTTTASATHTTTYHHHRCCNVRNECCGTERGCNCCCLRNHHNLKKRIHSGGLLLFKKRRRNFKSNEKYPPRCVSSNSSNSCLKVRPHSNVSAVTIFSICEQLQKAREHKKYHHGKF